MKKNVQSGKKAQYVGEKSQWQKMEKGLEARQINACRVFMATKTQ